MFAYKVKPVVTPQKSFLHFLRYVQIHPTAVMSAADSVARHGGFEARFAIAVIIVGWHLPLTYTHFVLHADID